jgi:hypothetical protein
MFPCILIVNGFCKIMPSSLAAVSDTRYQNIPRDFDGRLTLRYRQYFGLEIRNTDMRRLTTGIRNTSLGDFVVV